MTNSAVEGQVDKWDKFEAKYLSAKMNFTLSLSSQVGQVEGQVGQLVYLSPLSPGPRALGWRIAICQDALVASVLP